MGRVTFDESNKIQTSADFPKLKLEKDARARIVCLEAPVAEYVHTLRAPKIVNGIPETKMFERKDGTKYEDYVLDFIGRPLCLGDEGILKDRGTDPKNCPVCALAAEGDLTQPPQRRFAMHVVQYQIKPGGFELQQPFGAQVVIWSFTDKTFNKLVDFQTEWGSLQRHDLLLGPCTNPTFQQFDLQIAAKAEWLEGEERKKQVAHLFKENQTKDLTEFCGRKVETKWLLDDLDKIRARWAVVNQSGPRDDVVSRSEEASLTEGLEDLLGDVAAPAAKVEEPVDLDALMGDAPVTTPAAEPVAATASADVTADLLADLGAVTPAEEKPATPETVMAKPGSSGETVQFDDLLSGIV